jgi:hypothetical protein
VLYAPLAAQAALDAIEKERAELVFRASRDERRVYDKAMSCSADKSESARMAKPYLLV